VARHLSWSSPSGLPNGLVLNPKHGQISVPPRRPQLNKPPSGFGEGRGGPSAEVSQRSIHYRTRHHNFVAVAISFRGSIFHATRVPTDTSHFGFFRRTAGDYTITLTALSGAYHGAAMKQHGYRHIVGKVETLFLTTFNFHRRPVILAVSSPSRELRSGPSTNVLRPLLRL